ncbi:MAG: sensor histidine kinase [Planctomycetales bacterium]
MLRTGWMRWSVVLAAWTLVGLFFTSQHYLHVAVLLDRQATWWRSLLSTIPDWYLWAALTPLIVRLAHWYPLVDRRTLGPRLLMHCSAGAVLAMLHMFLSVSFFLWLAPIPCMVTGWSEQFQLNFVSSYHWNVLIYALLVAITHAANYYSTSQSETRRAWQLEARLAQARLQALQAQIHPHFLFNTLNTIAELIHERPAAAEAMILHLATLLRQTLDGADAPIITLEEELESIRRYLEIELVRFEDRLTVRWAIDPQVRGALLPRLLLQPVIENAIRHGTSRVARHGQIDIRASGDGEKLQIEIRDNGAGLAPAEVKDRRGGVGLANIKARLREYFGDDQSFQLAAGPGQGAVAVLVLPLRWGRGAGSAGASSGNACRVVDIERTLTEMPSAPAAALRDDLRRGVLVESPTVTAGSEE